ncbi:MAG: isoprenylcysteine carboxylmethyltransferase family protein [Deltaproteobacteria bacterium]
MIHKGEQLSTRGPYSLIRHPLYTGSLCMALGFCLIIGDNINLPTILVAGFLLYAPTIRKEERELASKFGPLWQDYAQKTGVLLPKKISADIFSKWHLPQWFKNREYRAMTVGLTALALLELLHELPVSTTFLAGG